MSVNRSKWLEWEVLPSGVRGRWVVACLNCDHVLSVSRGSVGRVRCPDCGAEFDGMMGRWWLLEMERQAEIYRRMLSG